MIIEIVYDELQKITDDRGIPMSFNSIRKIENELCFFRNSKEIVFKINTENVDILIDTFKKFELFKKQ